MTLRTMISLALAGSVLLQGCAVAPAGPTVQVIPGPGKPFEIFAQEQALCQQYATSQTAGQTEQANQRAVGGAVLGTVLGAGLGAAVGGGRGAGIGAASGALFGTGVGANSSTDAAGGIQLQYDNAYTSCMIAKGNRVPEPAPVYVQPTPYIVEPAPYIVQPRYRRPYY